MVWPAAGEGGETGTHCSSGWLLAGKGACCARRAGNLPLPRPGDASLRLALRNAPVVGLGSSSPRPPAVGRCGAGPDSSPKRARGRAGIFPAVFRFLRERRNGCRLTSNRILAIWVFLGSVSPSPLPVGEG